MTVEQRIQQGDFEGALALIAAEIAGSAPDPGRVLQAFHLEVRLQRFDAAERSIKRVVALAPQLAAAATMLAQCARADATVAARLVDPVLSSKRGSIGPPPPHASVYMKATVHHARNDAIATAAALEEARNRTPKTPGKFNLGGGLTKGFDHLVDSDDLTGPILLCYQGDAVLDVPFCLLRSIRFQEPQMSFDTLWIPTEIIPHDGQPWHVRVPAFYAGSGVASERTLRIGTMTTWDYARGYAIGLGQRDLRGISQGSQGPVATVVGVRQLRGIDFDPPSAPAIRSTVRA